MSWSEEVKIIGKPNIETEEVSVAKVDTGGNLHVKSTSDSLPLPSGASTEAKQDDVIAAISELRDSPVVVALHDDPIYGDVGPIQQHEIKQSNYPAIELLTYDTNISEVLGTQRLISQDNKKLKVESSMPDDLSVYGKMNLNLREVIINLTGMATVGFQLSGTWSGTISFYGSIDGSTWYAWSCQVSQAILSTAAISSTSNGVWQARVAGLKAFKVAFSAYTSGVCYAILNASYIPISYQTQVTATVNGSQAQLLSQRNATYELSTNDSALREAFYITEPYNANIIYFPGDVVVWNGRTYRCILQTVLTATVSSPASATYWTVDYRPSRSTITKDYISYPDAPRVRVEIDMDGYQYRLAEATLVSINSEKARNRDFQEKLLYSIQSQGGGYGISYYLGQEGMSHYDDEAR
jgi:hypothetical protein